MPRPSTTIFEARDLDDLQLTIERAHNAELRAELEVRLPMSPAMLACNLNFSLKKISPISLSPLTPLSDNPCSC